MSELSLHFEVVGAGDAELEQAAQALRESLLTLPTVESAQAVTTGTTRLTGVEIMAGIAVGVAIVKGGSELIEALRKSINGIKEIASAFKTKSEDQPAAPVTSQNPPVTNIKIINVVVDIGFRSVPLSELTEDDLNELERRLAPK